MNKDNIRITKQKDLKYYDDNKTFRHNPIKTFIIMSTLGIISLCLMKIFFPHNIGPQMIGAWKIIPTIIGSFILAIAPIKIFNCVKWSKKYPGYDTLKQVIKAKTKNMEMVQTNSILLVIPALWLEPRFALLEFVATFTIILIVTNSMAILSITYLLGSIPRNMKKRERIYEELCTMCKEGDKKIECPYDNDRKNCYAIHPELWERDKKMIEAETEGY